jgi:uncharacterized BrkB/YihY/UPF0761 family membrane protein
MDEPVIKKTDDSGVIGASSASESSSVPPKRGGLNNFFLAINHINQASLADSVKQRFSDYVTVGLVCVCILSLVAAVMLPVPPALRLLPLIFTVGAIIFFIVNRLGIILALTQRQALLVWQIMIASFWLGVTSSMLVILVMLSCLYQVAPTNQLQSAPPSDAALK